MEEIHIVIESLIWDDWNIDHISLHDVVPEEVELSLTDDNKLFIQAKQGRVIVLGRSGKRLLTTVLNPQETEGAYYVITARDMSKKERAFFRSNGGK